MALEVNFQDELIYVTSPQTDVLVQDLIDIIRDREDDEEGILYPKIADASGKEDLGEGVRVGITLNLLDDWQVKFWDGNYIAKVSGGNLVGGPAGDPVAYSPGVQVLLIQSAASTIIDLGSVAGLSEEQSDHLFSIPTLAEIEGSNVLAKQAELLRALGLTQENYYLDQTTYDEYQGQPLLTGGRIRLYANKQDVGTDNGVSAEYTVSSAWQNNRLQTYKVEGGAITTTTTTSTTAPPHWWYDPLNLIINVGSVDGGVLSDLEAQDGNELLLGEETGSPGWDYLIEFEDVPDKNVGVYVYGYYEGNPAHQNDISAFNFTTYSFDKYTASNFDFPDAASPSAYNFSMDGDRSNYISDDGDVIVRLRHGSIGTPGHNLHLDRVRLTTIAPTSTTTTT